MSKLSKNKFYFLIGLLAGILLTALFLSARSLFPEPKSISGATQETTSQTLSSIENIQSSASEPFSSSEETVPLSSDQNAQAAALSSSCPPWSADAVYNGGDRVLYQDRIYRAKWWTQNEVPGAADVWEDTLETPAVTGLDAIPSESLDSIIQAQKDADNTAYVRGDTQKEGAFKVVAYYPSWKGEQFNKLQYDVLTHIVYAFAIPNPDGTLKPLDNPELARRLIQDAHRNQAGVLLAVGGWSYNDVPLEAAFMEATSDDEKLRRFGDQILEMCDAYGFDGVDMDWEHPRIDGDSSARYEALMLYLAERLHADGKLLTSAVISGATADGNIYYDAAAHTDKVLNAVDWIHVMAYDGGDGERHSSYEFAVNCGSYWKDSRHLPASKIVLGVPFYARPSWAAYSDILSSDPNAWNKDIADYNGMQAHYNGVSTISKKTRYAMDNLGGMMIWEITQDTADKEKSLLHAIGKAIKAP